MHATTDVRLLVPLLFGASAGAGVLGALTGLGGGVVIVPLLTLAFGVNIRYAVGASLVSVMATSSGAAAVLARESTALMQLGLMSLVATPLARVAFSDYIQPHG